MSREPWTQRADSVKYRTVSDSECKIVAQVPRVPGGDADDAARRIVACVNALAGISTESLEVALADCESDRERLEAIAVQIEHAIRAKAENRS